MKVIRHALFCNLMFKPENWLERQALKRKGFVLMTSLRGETNGWYSRVKYTRNPYRFAPEQKVIYSGSDSFLRGMQKSLGHIIVDYHWDHAFICIKGSPMSYPARDFQEMQRVV